MIDEILNAGNDMAQAVSDAVASGDFSHLNEDLQNSARKMTDSVKAGGQDFANRAKSGFSQTPYVDLNGADVRVGQRGAGKADGNTSWTNGGNAGTYQTQNGQNPYTSASAGAASYGSGQTGTHAYGGTQTRTNPYGGNTAFGGAFTKPDGGRQTPPAPTRETVESLRQAGRTGRRMRSNYFGEGKNIALTIVGFIGLVVNVPICIGFLGEIVQELSYHYMQPGYLARAIFFGICSGIFGWMTAANLSTIRTRNFARLIDSAAGDAEYIDLKDLAARLAMPFEKVQKSVMKVLQKGILPDAHIDTQGTTLMLSDRAYKQYAEAEHSRIQREAEELEKEHTATAKARAAAAKAKEEEKAAEKSTGNKDVDRILSEGRDYIRTIREINDKIPDTGDTKEMSDKLYTLEDIVRRIMDQVRKDPGSAGNVQMLMDYYLPTTVKLLNAYVGVMNQPAGENIESTKREIEASMDTINAACLKVLDGMFADVAWDVSSDINVMKQMMARDGLTEPGAKKEKAPVE